MWIGDKIYFVSDRTGIYNLFVTDLKTKAVKQLTNFDRQGIRTAAAASDAICFVQNGKLHLFDLANNQAKTIEVSVTPDTSELKARTVPAMRSFEVVYPSASGDKLVFGARGEVLLFDANGNEEFDKNSGVANDLRISRDGNPPHIFPMNPANTASHSLTENDSVRKWKMNANRLFLGFKWSRILKNSFFRPFVELWLAERKGTAKD